MAAVSFEYGARITLADINNLSVQHLVREAKPQSVNEKKYVEQLLKEEVQLMKTLADRDKIIKVTRIELQKLRVNQQKMQEQNKQLAQSNNQYLGEIHATKEKFRALQHEFACRNGVLRALQDELKSKIRVNVSEEECLEVELIEVEDLRKLSTTGQSVNKLVTFNKRIHSKSLGIPRQVQSKEKTGNKRARVRRQSARFNFQEEDSTDDSFAIPETKLSACQPHTDFVLEDCLVTSMEAEDKDGRAAITHEHKRASMGRPSRMTTQKVQSYKEIPLKVKMRRPD